MRLYSHMNMAELQIEMERLQREAAERKKAGDLVGYGIREQKYFLAKSYYLGTSPFAVGRKYRVYGRDGWFVIDYFNGVFAWGRFEGSDETVGFPVGMLEE